MYISMHVLPTFSVFMCTHEWMDVSHHSEALAKALKIWMHHACPCVCYACACTVHILTCYAVHTNRSVDLRNPSIHCNWSTGYTLPLEHVSAAEERRMTLLYCEEE